MMLSIVLPAYNEANRLKPSLERILEYLKQRPALEAEVIVADDGSLDRTADIARSFAPAVRLVQITHHGKGAAVRAGVLASQGDLL